MRFFEAFRFHLRHFGIGATLKLAVIPRVLSKFKTQKDYYIPALLGFQRRLNKKIIEKYQNIHTEDNINGDYLIWTSWWQGYDNMPDIIRKCHDSLLRNCNGHKVILITKDNYADYVTIPDKIVKKMRSGIISLSHFSDILRLSLLTKYGGMWVDSALYIIQPLKHHDKFFMPRMAHTENVTLCQGRWWFGVMAGPAEHKIFRYMLDTLVSYWEKYDAAVTYLMFDGFLRIAYEEFSDVKRTVDNLIVSSPDLHSSRYTFNDAVDYDRLNHLIKNKQFLSLTRINKYKLVTDMGLTTFYGALVARDNQVKE